MSKERPFEDIIPVPNIKVGYFEKEEYLKIIDRQEKQIEAFAYQIMALQSRIEILEKSQRPQGECKSCRHRDPEDKKCDCGAIERQGCPFPVSDDYYCKHYEKGGAE